MATDDRRMHEGRSRSLDDREPRDRGSEEPRSEGDFIGSGERAPGDGAVEDVEVSSTTDREQESALGGHVATRSKGPDERGQ